MDKNNVAYCIDCDEKKAYSIKTRRVDMEVRGVAFSYVEHVAYCIECGKEVYVPEINDLNVYAREEAFRKA